MHLLILDTSKAFNTVGRAILLKDSITILDPEEPHLKFCLIVSWYYKDTGVWKGDGLIANELTLYLVRALYKENNDHICKKSTITTSSELSSV